MEQESGTIRSIKKGVEEMKIKLRCETVFKSEQCCLVEDHKGDHKHHWITQKQINKRLVACGYGHSMFPANWWSKKELVGVEKVMKAIHNLENAMGKKLTSKQISELLTYWRKNDGL